MTFLTSPALAYDSLTDAAKQDRMNERNAVCKEAGALAKIVVTEVSRNDPEREKYWLSQMNGTSFPAQIVKMSFVRRSFMGPLEAEAAMIKDCKLGKIKGQEDLREAR